MFSKKYINNLYTLSSFIGHALPHPIVLVLICLTNEGFVLASFSCMKLQMNREKKIFDSYKHNKKSSAEFQLCFKLLGIHRLKTFESPSTLDGPKVASKNNAC